MSLPVQDVGLVEVSLPKADDDTDEDLVLLLSAPMTTNRPVNNTNKNELVVLQFLENTSHQTRHDRFE